MTCEDGISVTHTLDGVFEVANNAEKALGNLKDGVAKLGQTIYYARNIEVNLPDALFVPNSLLNQFRRETAEMLDEARLANYPRGSRKAETVPAPVYLTRISRSSRTFTTTKRVRFTIVTACS